jgi:hypothetical protein
MSASYCEADIAEYLDREWIRDVMFRYARAIDRCDPQLLEQVYWPDGIDDHGDFVGSRDEFIAWVMPILKNSMGVTQHFLGNILIRIEGGSAKVESYFQAFHRWEGPDGLPAKDLIMGGRYLDRMEKRGKEWRIAHRTVAFDYFREYADSGDWHAGKYANPRRLLSARAPVDASCTLFADTLAKTPFTQTD